MKAIITEGHFKFEIEVNTFEELLEMLEEIKHYLKGATK